MLRNVDFYVGTGSTAEWIGSLRQVEVKSLRWIRAARSEDAFRERVRARMAKDPNACPRENGWPWSYETSAHTDRVVRFGADLKAHTYKRNQLYPWPSWREKGWSARKAMRLPKRLGGKTWII